MLLKENKLEESREVLTMLARTAPDFPNIFAAVALAHEALAKRAASENNAPEAAKQFQTAIKFDPSRLPYYMELAQLLLNHETPEPAELVLQNAAARFPRNPELLRMLGLLRAARRIDLGLALVIIVTLSACVALSSVGLVWYWATDVVAIALAFPGFPFRYLPSRYFGGRREVPLPMTGAEVQ